MIKYWTLVRLYIGREAEGGQRLVDQPWQVYGILIDSTGRRRLRGFPHLSLN